MIQRRSNWPTLLDNFLSSRADSSFVWGQNDCVLFACDAVLAMTGTDIIGALRGRYASELGAAKLMRRLAGGGLREAAEAIAYAWRIEQLAKPAFAQRGDVVLLPNELGEALGIVSLDGRWAVSIGANGVIANPLQRSLLAWRI